MNEKNNFIPEGWELVPNQEEQQIDTSALQQDITPSQEPSYLKDIGNFLKGIVGTTIQAPFDYLAAPGKYARENQMSPEQRQQFGLPEVPGFLKAAEKGSEALGSLADIVKEKTGGEYQPENLVSKTIHSFAQNWPIDILFGAGSLAKKAGQGLASSFGVESAKSLGLGVPGQILGGALASVGFNKLSSIAKQEPSKRAKLIENLYKREKELGSQIPVEISAAELKPFEESYNKTIGSKNARLYSKDFSEHASSYLNDLKNNKNLTAADIFADKTKFNEIYKSTTAGLPELERKAANLFNKNYNDLLESIGKKHPEWWSYNNSVNNLKKLEYWQQGLWDTLTSTSALKKVAQENAAPLVLLGGAAASGIISPKTLAKLGLAKVGIDSIKNGTLFLKHLSQTKEGMKLMSDLIAGSAKQSPSIIAKSINKLGKEYEKINKEYEWIPEGWELAS